MTSAITQMIGLICYCLKIIQEESAVRYIAWSYCLATFSSFLCFTTHLKRKIRNTFIYIAYRLNEKTQKLIIANIYPWSINNMNLEKKLSVVTLKIYKFIFLFYIQDLSLLLVTIWYFDMAFLFTSLNHNRLHDTW